MKLWFRFLFFRLASTFAFLLLSLFLLYVLVDLSINSVRFLSSGKTAALEIALYYARNFSEHLELFFPLGFLLASMKVLFDLNLHREIVALQMAGLSKKKLLIPFFLFAFFLSASSYINNQWLAPQAQEAAQAFRSEHAKKKKKAREQVFPLSLEDGTELVYQSFNVQKNQFFDVFWLRTPDEIWHMKHLKADSPPVGLFVDRFCRNSSNQFEKQESFNEKIFPELQWDKTAPLQRFVAYENRSLSTLFHQALSDSADKPNILSHLHYKLALPLFPFLILLAIGPFSLKFSRSLPFFFFAACALFAFAALCTILDGMLILGENRVLSPFIAIWTPLLFAFGISARSFLKGCR